MMTYQTFIPENQLKWVQNPVLLERDSFHDVKNSTYKDSLIEILLSSLYIFYFNIFFFLAIIFKLVFRLKNKFFM